jgi:hypothetical protein
MFVTLIITDVDSTFAVVSTRFSVFLKPCGSSKLSYQHIVSPDLTAFFTPIFVFTTSYQLIIFHVNSTGNVKLKLINAVIIKETTVIRTEESSGKTIDKSNRKKTTETIE